MDPVTPRDAQRIVAAYLAVVDAHAASHVYPCSLSELPQSKEIIRAAFGICVRALSSTGQLTIELRDYLEIAYVSLADYVSDECAVLLRQYGRAGEELAADGRLARDKAASDAWQRLSDQSRLAGQLARAIAEEADRLRAEFESWQSPAPAAS